MDLTPRGNARALVRVGSLAAITTAGALFLGAPAGANGDTPESIACNQIIVGVPGTLLQNVATRVDGSDASTIELTVSRSSDEPTGRLLDCVWVDHKPNGLLDPNEALLRTVGDVPFTVTAGSGVARVTEVDVPTGGAGGDRVCTVAAIVAPEPSATAVANVASKSGAESLADARSNGTPPTTPQGPPLQVLQASNISCVAGVLPVISESSSAAMLSGAGIAAVLLLGGGAWFLRARRARTASTR